jgi:hypothetical protein
MRKTLTTVALAAGVVGALAAPASAAPPERATHSGCNSYPFSGYPFSEEVTQTSCFEASSKDKVTAQGDGTSNVMRKSQGWVNDVFTSTDGVGGALGSNFVEYKLKSQVRVREGVVMKSSVRSTSTNTSSSGSVCTVTYFIRLKNGEVVKDEWTSGCV